MNITRRNFLLGSTALAVVGAPVAAFTIRKGYKLATEDEAAAVRSKMLFIGDVVVKERANSPLRKATKEDAGNDYLLWGVWNGAEMISFQITPSKVVPYIA